MGFKIDIMILEDKILDLYDKAKKLECLKDIGEFDTFSYFKIQKEIVKCQDELCFYRGGNVAFC